MKRTSLTLLVAAAFGVAGIAQAETFDTPQEAGEASTMTQGAPNLVTNNLGVPGNPLVVEATPLVIDTDPLVVDATPLVFDTTVLGAAPAVISSDSVVTTTTFPATVYVQPNINWTPIVTSRLDPLLLDRNDSTPTFNVPSRAGEASTMTEGVPNLVTNNDRVILQSPYPVILY